MLDEAENKEEPLALTEKKKKSSLPEGQKVSAEKIRELMEEYGGNKTKAAEALHISRTTLWKYLKDV